MSQNEIVRFALNNCWLEEQGVPDLRAIWIKLHYGPKAPVSFEPPCTEPSAGWCGTGELITPRDPIPPFRHVILIGIMGHAWVSGFVCLNCGNKRIIKPPFPLHGGIVCNVWSQI